MPTAIILADASKARARPRWMGPVVLAPIRYSTIAVTMSAPTVRLPSRIAKRDRASNAIALLSSIAPGLVRTTPQQPERCPEPLPRRWLNCYVCGGNDRVDDTVDDRESWTAAN